MIRRADRPKQARDRKTQAILPIRGKILNVASANAAKIGANQEIADLILALGCGVRERCDAANLRYERIVIMTDADVDGAHIATLLMTFFFQEMAPVVREGHVYLAQPPLYRLTAGGKSLYAMDEASRAAIETGEFKGKKIEVARFKGLGEMNPQQLRETTMDAKSRTLIRITLPQEYEERAQTRDLVERLMGRNPEHRFAFIQANAAAIEEAAIDALMGIDASLPFLPVRIAVLTVSDSRTAADDRSGDTLASRIAGAGHIVADRAIVRDDADAIVARLDAWIDDDQIDCVISTGGTGVTGRDVTPEAYDRVCEKKIEGFGELFRWLSFRTIGTSTIQSRATAGVARGTYLFALPGSTGAVRDGWDEILVHQLDSRHRPCNFVDLMPRLRER